MPLGDYFSSCQLSACLQSDWFKEIQTSQCISFTYSRITTAAARLSSQCNYLFCLFVLLIPPTPQKVLACFHSCLHAGTRGEEAGMVKLFTNSPVWWYIETVFVLACLTSAGPLLHQGRLLRLCCGNTATDQVQLYSISSIDYATFEWQTAVWCEYVFAVTNEQTCLHARFKVHLHYLFFINAVASSMLHTPKFKEKKKVSKK